MAFPGARFRAEALPGAQGVGESLSHFHQPHELVTRSRSALVIALVAVAGGGCGSPSSKSGESAAAFRSRANAVCATIRPRAEQLGRTYPQIFKEQSSPTPAEAVKPYSELLSLAEDERRQLSLINPPAEDQSTYTELLTGMDAGIKEWSRLVQTARAGDQEHLKAVEAELNSSGPAKKQQFKADFTSLGLVTCSEAETETTGQR